MGRSLVRFPVPTLRFTRCRPPFRYRGGVFSFLPMQLGPCRWFAPSWTICTNSPFSPTTAPVQVTNLLHPTLKDTTNSPLAVAIGNGLEELGLEIMRLLRLNWMDKFWWLRSSKPVTSVQRVLGLREPSKNRLAGRFFRLLARDYAQRQTISRGSF